MLEVIRFIIGYEFWNLFSECLGLNDVDRAVRAQAQGKTMESYVAEHQDRSRNALLKSLEAAFKSWCEDLRADESQFLAEKILYLGFGLRARCWSRFIVLIFSSFWWEASFCPLIFGISVRGKRLEKECAKSQAKLVKQLEDTRTSRTRSINYDGWLVGWRLLRYFSFKDTSYIMFTCWYMKNTVISKCAFTSSYHYLYIVYCQIKIFHSIAFFLEW